MMARTKPSPDQTTKTAEPQSVQSDASTPAQTSDRPRILRSLWKLHRTTGFYLVCVVSLFTIIWVFAQAWQQQLVGENDNWFHEFLLLFFLAGLCAQSYFKIYRNSRSYLAEKEAKDRNQKAKRAADKAEELARKEKVFQNLINNFQAAESFADINSSMIKLLAVGVESKRFRQQVVGLLGDLNAWMYENEVFLPIQSLMGWRLKKNFFEPSDKIQVDSNTQDISINAINIIEAIIKRHLSEFKSGEAKFALDLSNIALPTLTLTSQTIPAGSLRLDKTILWQASFSESFVDRIGFDACQLQKASFWRAKLKGVDFEGSNLQYAKLRTNLQKIKNLEPAMFFQTKEWELCFLSREQINQFFPLEDRDKDKHWSVWSGGEDRRKKLYFNIEQL